MKLSNNKRTRIERMLSNKFNIIRCRLKMRNGQLTLGNNNSFFFSYYKALFYLYSLFVSLMSFVFLLFLFFLFLFLFLFVFCFDSLVVSQ